MSVRGATMVYLEDGSIDTIERLYRIGKDTFNTFGLDDNGEVVPVEVTDLRIDEAQPEKFYHIVFEKSFELVCDRWQKLFTDSGEYKYVTELHDNDYIKNKIMYFCDKPEKSFHTGSMPISIAFSRPAKCHEHTYRFDSSLHNIIIPQIIYKNGKPLPEFRRIIKDGIHFTCEPTSITFISLYDNSY